MDGGQKRYEPTNEQGVSRSRIGSRTPRRNTDGTIFEIWDFYGKIIVLEWADWICRTLSFHELPPPILWLSTRCTCVYAAILMLWPQVMGITRCIRSSKDKIVALLLTISSLNQTDKLHLILFSAYPRGNLLIVDNIGLIQVNLDWIYFSLDPYRNMRYVSFCWVELV